MGWTLAKARTSWVPILPPSDRTWDPASSALIRDQVDRILKSPEFSRAPALQALLQYVVDRTLAGDLEALKERAVGIGALHRTPDFDPVADPVVRVQARALRAKLERYYRTCGQNDPVLIEVPRGHYVARFYRRRGLVLGRFGVSKRRRLLAMASLLVLTVFSTWLFSTAGRPPYGRNRTAAPAPPAFWRPFLEGDTTVIVYGVPQFFRHEGLYIRDVRVNRPDPAAHPRLRLLEHLLAPLEPVEIYTGIGEANSVFLLATFLARHGASIRLERASQLHLEDVRNANVIFVGSCRFSSPLNRLVSGRCFAFQTSGDETSVEELVTSTAGKSMYRRTQGPGWESDIGVLALLPGLTANHYLLVLRGAGTWGTQGATEFALNPECARQLSTTLSREGSPEPFEALLEVRHDSNRILSVQLLKECRPHRITQLTQPMAVDEPGH